MTLSTLTIPGMGYGLWDNDSNKYLHIGTEDECDSMKHSLEREEQALSNAQWKNNLYQERLSFLLKAGMPENNARGVVDRMFRMAKA